MKYNPKACNQYAMLPEFLGAPSARARIARPGLSRLPVRAAGDAQSGHGHAGRSALAHGGRARRVRRRGHDPRLSPRARRCRRATRSSFRKPLTAPIPPPPPCAAAWCARSRWTRDGDVDIEALQARGRPAYRRHHAHQPIDARGVRAAHRGGGAGGARGRRAALLRRRQPQRDPRQGAPRGHGLRCHSHEPAQDLLHAARRRRPGRGCGRRGRASAAVPARADRRLGGGRQGGRALPLAHRE